MAKRALPTKTFSIRSFHPIKFDARFESLDLSLGHG